MNIEAVTTVATTDTSHHHQWSIRKHHILRTTPQVALGVGLLATSVVKTGLGGRSYSYWKKCNMSIPLREHGIRIHFDLDETPNRRLPSLFLA
jgi:hypothetical protein